MIESLQNLSFDPSHDETYRCRTEDGWELHLYRYRAKGDVPKKRLPVLLVHGGASTRFSWDLGDGIGLAPWLAGRGHEVWTVDLRGRKRAGKWYSRVKLPQWTFDHLVEFDLPAAIHAVRKYSGSPAIHYIGHSMGGMIAYCYLIRFRGEGLERVVTLGSPAFVKGAPPWVALLRSWIYRFGPDMRLDWITKAAAPFAGRLPESMLKSSVNFENVDRAVLARYMWRGIAAIPSRKAAHFSRIASEGGLITEDGRFRYFEHLNEIKTPIYVIAGKADGLADWRACRETFEKIGSTDRKFRLLARSEGEKFDYSHADLLWGKYAPEELFPDILSFLWGTRAELRVVG